MGYMEESIVTMCKVDLVWNNRPTTFGGKCPYRISTISTKRYVGYMMKSIYDLNMEQAFIWLNMTWNYPTTPSDSPQCRILRKSV
jgi:hypothetical protein